MGKIRPVVVVSKNMKSRSGIVTVLPLSTKTPVSIEAYHYLIPKPSLPNTAYFQDPDCWLKGDMIYTAGFHRLDLIRVGGKGRRNYFYRRLGREKMKLIYACMLHGLGLGQLSALL